MIRSFTSKNGMSAYCLSRDSSWVVIFGGVEQPRCGRTRAVANGRGLKKGQMMGTNSRGHANDVTSPTFL